MKGLKSKRIVVVLGMHRSGTSLVTRGLIALGVDLGDNLMLPAPDNEKGFWEDNDINALNIELMNHLGYDWDTITPIDAVSFQDKDIKPFILRAVELLNKKLQNTEIFGIKDPRMSKLMPFWKIVFNHIHVDVGYVVLIRNPLSVIKSLNKRDDFDTEKSSYLWLTHIASSIIDSENSKRVFVDYDILMDNPEKELARIANVLDLQFDKGSLHFQEYIKEFITNDLRHTKFTIDDISLLPEIPKEVIETFEILIKLAKDELSADSDIVHIYFNNLSNSLERMRSIFNYVAKKEREIRIFDNKILGLNKILANKEKEILDISLIVGNLEEQKLNIEDDKKISLAQINQKNQEVANLNQTIQQKDQEIKSKNQELQLKEQNINQKIKEIEKKNEAIINLHNVLQLRDDTVHALRHSSSWKITWPIRFIKNSILKFIRLIKKVFVILKRDGLILFLKKVIYFLARRNIILAKIENLLKPNANDIAINIFNIQQQELSKEAMMLRIKSFPKKPLISIIMPVYNTYPKWLKIAVESVLSQVYDNWELCIVDDCSTNNDTRMILRKYSKIDQRIKVIFSEKNSGISITSNISLEMAKGEYIALLDHDDELTKDALFWMVKELNDHPDADFVYSDECKIDDTDNRKLFDFIFKPNWSPEMMLNCMYTGHLSIYKKTLVDKLGGFRSLYDFSQDYDLALRVSEKTKHIYHVERVLYLWRAIAGSAAKGGKDFARKTNLAALGDAMRRRGVKAKIIEYPWANRAKILFKNNKKVSIIIPSDSYDNLIESINAIAKGTIYDNFEIVAVTNSKLINKLTPIFTNFIKNLVFSTYDKKYNFSDKCNQGAHDSSGEILVFLNDDVFPTTKDWLQNLIEFLFYDEKIGGVSPKLLSEDNTIQYAGMTTNTNPFCGTFLNGRSKDENLAIKVRNTLILSGACFAIRKKVFLEIDGFDAVNTPAGHSDLDLSFKLREKEYRCVYTPYATLHHLGNHSWHIKKDKADIFILSKWGKYISNDPYYTKSMRAQLEGYLPEQFAIFSHQTKIRQYSFDALIVLHELTLTGAPMVALNTAKAIINAGGYPVLYSYADGPLRVEFEKMNIPIIINSLARNDEFSFRYFAKNFDIIIANTVVVYPSVYAIQDIVPTIWFIHEAQSIESYFIPIFQNAKPSLKNVLKYNHSFVYVASEYSKNSVIKYCKDVKILNLGVDDRFDNKIIEIDKKIVFTIVGTIEKRKAQDIFIKAVMQIPQEYRNKAVFNIIGNDKSCENFSNKLKIETKNTPEIIWHGLITDQEKKMKLFSETSIFVVVSRDEPTSIIVIEGAMMGRPSIISKNVGAKYLIEEGKTGFIIETDNIEQLKNTIMNIIDDPQMLISMGKEARKKYLETSTFNVFQDNLMKIIKEKLKN